MLAEVLLQLIYRLSATISVGQHIFDAPKTTLFGTTTKMKIWFRTKKRPKIAEYFIFGDDNEIENES